MRRIRTIAVSVLVSVSLVACATFVRNSYITLNATGVTYNVVMTGVSGAQQAGKITADQRAKINQGAGIFKASYIVGVDGLLAYKNNPATDTQAAVSYAIASLLANWVDLSNLINSILPGTVPVTAMNTILLKGKTATGEKFKVTIKKLDTGEISVIIQIGATVLQYLIPAVQSLINDMGKITISDEDILVLKSLIKDPELY